MSARRPMILLRRSESWGAQGAFVGKFYDVPHRFGIPMQEDAFV